MVRESVTFGLSLLVTVVGLAIVLYGVSLNAGLALNEFMLAGGGVVLVAIALHTGALMSMDDAHDAA
ncbi:hypothetical protein [Halorussus litoreus]|uniref:hypothetical protein n=1 Tax=Halorussus litoreus TaxID=1710536 RepID=UPI000E229F98|nr:hypothetical protein [Halorussus litoreus]